MKKTLTTTVVVCILMALVSCAFDFGFEPEKKEEVIEECEHVWVMTLKGGRVDLASDTVLACTIVETCTKCGEQKGRNVLPTKGLTYEASGTDVKVSMGTCTETDIILPAKIKDVDGQIKNVTGIGDFSYSKISSILIPETITSIDDYAFTSCYYLTEITIPKGVTVGENCFSFCYNLQTVELPSDMTTVPYGCFSFCYALKNVTPEPLAKVNDDDQFLSCYLLGY